MGHWFLALGLVPQHSLLGVLRLVGLGRRAVLHHLVRLAVGRPLVPLFVLLHSPALVLLRPRSPVVCLVTRRLVLELVRRASVSLEAELPPTPTTRK